MAREISRIEPMLDEFRKLWEKYPDLSKEQSKYRLLKGCVRLKEPDNLQGYGMLHVKRVLTDSV